MARLKSTTLFSGALASEVVSEARQEVGEEERERGFFLVRAVMVTL